jgi:hypothetical protein
MNKRAALNLVDDKGVVKELIPRLVGGDRTQIQHSDWKRNG